MTITMPEIVVPKIDGATEQLVADLRSARDLIAVHGLVKEMFIGGGYCTVGAISKAANGGATMQFTPRAQRAVDAVADTLGRGGGRDDEGLLRRSALYDFNDSPFTEKADVLALFQVTIDRLSA